MLRLCLTVSLVWLLVLPAQAADPTQVFQQFFSGLQQLNQQPRRRKPRRSRIRQLVRACSKLNEQACQAIIDAKGMPPHANYTAFAIQGDIELRRGDRNEASKSYQHALRWAKRMRNDGHAMEDMESRLVSLRSTPAVSLGTAPLLVPARRSIGDLVCDSAAPVAWRSACQQAMQDPKGARLLDQPSPLLKQRGATLRQLLRCDEVMQKQQRTGLVCFESNGIVGNAV